MLRMLEKQREEEGFTLIELLVVVIIIGILAAIAIPVFLNQREKARNASANSDLRNLITAQEGFFTENDHYSEDADVNGELADNGLTSSTNVFVCVNTYDKDGADNATNDGEVFRAMTYHSDGTLYYYYDSQEGQIQKGGSVEDNEKVLTGTATNPVTGAGVTCDAPNPA